jgi:hypothetical protein
MPASPDRAWQHPWLRISLLLRAILTARWDADAGKQIRAQIPNALAIKDAMRQSGWFN